MQISEHRIYKEYRKMREERQLFDIASLPLCASENIISPFCRLPLEDMLYEKYLLGGTMNFSQTDNFVGSELLFKVYSLISRQASTLFHCKYADARTLSGLNCVTSILMTLTEIGDTIIISSVESGGHSSISKIATRLGLNIIEAPYNFDEYDYDYDKINNIVKCKNIKLIFLSPSNIIYAPKLNKLDTSKVLLIYDASQTLGMIASGVLYNPLKYSDNIICIGSTHKTIPGPSCGIILTNNMDVASVIDAKINPDYLSVTQLQYKLVLLHSLIELEFCGADYSNKIQNDVEYLSKVLEKNSLFNLVHTLGQYSHTHQILIGINKNTHDNIERNSLKYNVTLNLSSKRNKLFRQDYGLRIGMQEVARYNWDNSKLDAIAEVLNYLSLSNPPMKIKEILDYLATQKKIHFTINE